MRLTFSAPPAAPLLGEAARLARGGTDEGTLDRPLGAQRRPRAALRRGRPSRRSRRRRHPVGRDGRPLRPQSHLRPRVHQGLPGGDVGALRGPPDDRGSGALDRPVRRRRVRDGDRAHRSQHPPAPDPAGDPPPRGRGRHRRHRRKVSPGKEPAMDNANPVTPLEKIVSPPSYGSELDLLSINTIRTLAADAVQKANAGHPGAPMGLAPAAYVLWHRFLQHNPANPKWFNRDRFVLSAGHASMLLYALLYLTGYGLTLDDIKQFRQWGSLTPGHPEYGHTVGVETTTGPLGQGFGTAVGMGIAERELAARYNRPGFPVVDHHTYVICSDGDVMEGISHEAASLAGHLRLGQLIYLYDSNKISIDGSTDLTFTNAGGTPLEGHDWHVQRVADGNELETIASAIEAAKADPRPSLIILRTHIGYGAPTRQDSELAHGQALGEEKVRGTKIRLGWD